MDNIGMFQQNVDDCGIIEVRIKKLLENEIYLSDRYNDFLRQLSLIEESKQIEE